MKNLIILAILTLFVSYTYAQSADRPSFGVRAGINFQNINGKDAEGDKLDNKLLVGFNIGANVEIPVAPEFYLQPGLLFTTKGAKSEFDSDIKTSISYIEVPVTFLYKPLLGTGRLLLGVGPYVAFGVGGKVKGLPGGDIDLEFEKEITPAQALTGAYLKRFDAGGNIVFGYELSNRWSAQLNAQLGLVNIKPDISGVDDDATMKNTGFGISVGYRF